jgi:hypothetical protein
MLRTKEGTKVNYWDYVRCEISGSHGGEYKDDNSLRYIAVGRDRRFRGAYIPGDGPDDKYSTHF